MAQSANHTHWIRSESSLPRVTRLSQQLERQGYRVLQIVLDPTPSIEIAPPRGLRGHRIERAHTPQGIIQRYALQRDGIRLHGCITQRG